MNMRASRQLHQQSTKSCPVCGSKKLKLFFQLSNVPIHCNVLWSSKKDAQNCPKGDIRLALCPACSFIMNLEFEPSRVEYTQAYENPLDFSPRFQVYSQSLATRLVKRYSLYNKKIIEIGCGRGHFLTQLCSIGNSRGVGFDPTYVEEAEGNGTRGQVKVIQDFYSERYRDYQGDLFICRQTLEHIQDPKQFLSMLRRAIANHLNAHVFFEVPNALQTFHRLFVWDIIYEHPSYFTPVSLWYTFASSGFQVLELNTEFEGQFLGIHAKLSEESVPNLDASQTNKVSKIFDIVSSFASRYQHKVRTLEQKLERVEDGGQRLVVWGAGSKGVTFLNTLKHLQVEYAVDINPHKHNKYVPGTGQKIMPPEFLRRYKPEVIIVMNPIYVHEIRQLVNELGLVTRLVCV